jgi:phosphatidylglycerol:prolipoprotein diacylglycerol transferase
MHPVLFHVGPFALHTYGVFVAMAFLSAIGLALKEARRVGEDADQILDLCFYILIAAIAGSRILYVMIEWPTFVNDPVEIVRIWHGGLIFYGGFFGAVMTALLYVRKKGLPVWKTADIIAPSIAFGQFVGRLGCFSAGCCYGKPSSLAWAVTFTHSESLAPIGIALHPTQLYSSLNGLVIFGLLTGLKRVKRFQGQIFWTYVLLYSVTRSIIEFFRGDDRGILLGGMVSISQFIGVITAAIAVAMIVVLTRRKQ